VCYDKGLGIVIEKDHQKSIELHQKRLLNKGM